MRFLKDILTSFLISKRRFYRSIRFSPDCEGTAEIGISRSFSKNRCRFQVSKNIFRGKYDNHHMLTMREVSDFYHVPYVSCECRFILVPRAACPSDPVGPRDEEKATTFLGGYRRLAALKTRMVSVILIQKLAKANENAFFLWLS